MSIESRGRSPVTQAAALLAAVLLGLALYFWLAPRAPVVARPPVAEGQP